MTARGALDLRYQVARANGESRLLLRALCLRYSENDAPAKKPEINPTEKMNSTSSNSNMTTTSLRRWETAQRPPLKVVPLRVVSAAN
jgi:hypothetical protein